MPPEKAEAIAKHLKEGCGIRKTARLVAASKDGVTNLAIRLGLHARSMHDERARGLDVKEAQFDEKWSFVGKKTYCPRSGDQVMRRPAGPRIRPTRRCTRRT